MDTEWAIKELETFLELTRQVPHQNDPSSGVFVLGKRMASSSSAAAEAAHVVEQILDQALRGWRAALPSPDRDYRGLREQAARGRAALHRQAEIEAKLGDAAPRVNLGALHPWVWDAARTLWADGHRALAVQQAAIAVNAQAKAKLRRRDVSETPLFQQAFSSDAPTPSAPRLRIDGYDAGDTSSKNRQRGAMALSEGLYAAIRNPLGHELAPEWTEDIALEMLAAFSMLARWVDDAAVERA